MNKTKLTDKENQILKLLTEKDNQIIKYKIWLERANLKIIKLENQLKKLEDK